MTTLLLYFKVSCPVGCAYCFELPSGIREYNLSAMLESLKDNYVPRDTIVLHGGEICTLPIRDLEYALRFCRRLLNENGFTEQPIAAQSSLYGMTSEHIRLFKKYNVGVGISVDGPPNLNILRGPRDPDKNSAYQLNLVENIQKLIDAGLHPGYISILSKANVSDDKIDEFILWASEKIPGGRMNPMFTPLWHRNSDKTVVNYQLSPIELKHVWLKLVKTCIEKRLNWYPFREFVDNLLGTFTLAPCIVTRCDYVSTTCKTIMGDGSLARCDRCFQEGYYGRYSGELSARSEMLKQTECSGCRYFEICGGGCPGEGMDGDPRHKTYYCEAYYAVYEYLERYLRGLMPNIVLSIDIPDYYKNYDRAHKRLNFTQRFGNGSWRASPPIDINTSNQNDAGKCPPGTRPHEDHYDYGRCTK